MDCQVPSRASNDVDLQRKDDREVVPEACVLYCAVFDTTVGCVRICRIPLAAAASSPSRQHMLIHASGA